MKEGIFVNKKNTVKIVLAMLLLGVACLSVLFFTKFLTNISVGADNPEVLLKGNLEKYINYKISDKDKGTLVQYGIEASVEQKEEQFNPIKERELTISLNQIDGKYPFAAKVIAKTTENTNGKVEDIEGNYQYDATTGIVTIKTSNVNENGDAINSSKPRQECKDEYSVICYYDIYTEESKERELNVKATLTASLFEEDEVITQEKEFKGTVIENVGELSSISYDTVDIANGNIKSNIINGTTYTTIYTETQNITISKKETQEKIKILENNTFIKTIQNENGEEVTEDLGNNGNLVYNSTKIKKQDITNLLGEDGVVEILDINETVIAKIDKDTQFQEDGTVVINYENEPEAIIIKISEIKNEGILKLENTKEIKSSMLEADAKIKTTSKLVGINENVEIVNEEEIKTEIEIFTNNYENMTNIKDAQTNVKMDLNTSEWTNKQQNEVTFDVYVNANSINDNMLKNPTIRIELPSEVEKVILGKSAAVYANGLELQEPYLETNENGNIVIAANLVGTQTQYDENTLGLVTDVKISATIILKKDIENTIGNVNLTFTNQYTLDGKIEVQTKTNEVQIESYKEENTSTTEDFNTTYTSATTNEATAEELEGLKLEVAPVRGDKTLLDGDIVYEGEFIKYNIKVTNTTDKKIDNIKVIGIIPEGTVYGELDADYYTIWGKYEYKYDDTIKEKTIDIGTLNAGESIDKFYEIKVNDLAEEDTEKALLTSIKTYIKDVETSNYEINHIANQAEVEVVLSANPNGIGKDGWNYHVQMISQEEKNVKVEIQLPKEFEIGKIVTEEGEEGITDISISEDNVITAMVDLTSKDSQSINWITISGDINSLKIKNKTENSEKELTAVATVISDNKSYKSNENRITYCYDNISIVMTSSNEGENVKYKDEINYEIIVKNIGKSNLNSYYATSIKLSDYLSEDLTPVSLNYENWIEELELTDEENNIYNSTGIFKKGQYEEEISAIHSDDEGNVLPNVDLSLTIPYGESVTIKIKTTAGFVYEKTKVENSITVSGNTIDAKTSNIITHIILPYDYEETQEPDAPEAPNTPDNPDNPDKPSDSYEKYSISGLAWIDKNEDGKRQTTEKLLKEVTVMLVDSNNANAIKVKQVTDSNGEYSFSGLDKGKYIVVFKYDTDTYSLTEYQKDRIIASLNSDAISKEITLLGEKTKVGVTDIISVDASIKNIDIGLVKNKICDLKLDKYISKVIVKTSSGTKEQSYNNAKLAKAEIKDKEIKGATVIVEYKLVITNEGEIPTSVNKVIDYLPKGLDFSSELNKSWIITKNAELENTSLTNQKIEPGESKELTLLLTKTMTSDSTGTFTNIAEIGDISNVLGIKDNDSMPGNRLENEDDYSKAELIISVSTGAIVYIFTILGILVLIGIILYLNMRFGINNITKFSLFIIMITLVVLVNFSNSTAANTTTAYLPDVLWLINPDQGHYFEGYDNAGNSYYAICDEQGGPASDSVYRKFEKIKETSTNTKESGSDEITGALSISKGTSDFTISVNNSYYILGPFKISSSNAKSYEYSVTTSEKTITGLKPCDSNGNDISITGSSFIFYVKISVNDISDKESIKKVNLTAKKNDVKVTSKYKVDAKAYYAPTTTYKAYWNSSAVTGGNCGTRNYKGVECSNWPRAYSYFYDAEYWFQPVYVTKTTNKTQVDTKNETETVNWEYKYGNLQIIKKDADNEDITLGGIKFEIKGPSYQDGITLITDAEGRTERLNNLLPGDYTIEEKSNHYYGYTDMPTKEINLKSGMTEIYEFKNTKQTGNLQIVKKDFHSNKQLQGVSFIVKKVERSDINQDGKISIQDVSALQKYIQSGESNYKIEPYGTGDVNNDGKINTDDAVLLQEYLAKKTTIGEGYIQAINENGTSKEVIGTISLTDMEVTTNSEEATIFTTDENGKIEIIDMLTGDYILEEISVGDDNWGYVVENNYITWNYDNTEGKGANIPIRIKRQSSTETDEEPTSTSVKYHNVLDVYNRQKYIKLSGYAWEDIVDSNKQTTRNYLYDQNAADKRLQYVAVTLVDEDGNNLEGTMTDENGQYIFEKVEIERIDNGGYIKFAYNGFSYQTVDINCINEKGEKVENGNTAKEFPENNKSSIIDSREEFNKQYATIEKNTVYKENGNILTNNLSYDSDEYTSKLNLKGSYFKYGYEGQKYPIRTSNNPDIYFIIASTEVNTNEDSYRLFGQNKTIEELLKEGKDEIQNINIGLYEREQPDIEILKDLYDVRVSVNGYTHIYEAGQAINHLTNNSNDAEAIFNAGVKFPSGKQTDYENISYRRAIYKADYDCDIPDKGLKVYATYVIKVRNTSTNLKVRVNEIMDYYHKAYTLEGIGTGINTETRELTGSVKKYTNDDENKTLSIELDTIMPGESMTEIYIQFSISKDKLGEFLDEATDNGEEYKYVDNLENIVEINSYSVFDENGKIYAGIDKDSNPGNADLNKLREKSIRRTEDDTSLAPGFRIEVRASREIEGTVFLDESVFAENSYETHPGETRNGNGIYEEGTERKISGVKVSLYKKDDLEKDSEGNYKIRSGASPIGKTTYNVSRTSTDSDGYFKISDFYPGDYNIVYTWGDKTYIEGNTNNPINVTDYKGTIYLNSKRTTEIDWYKDEKNRYSDAMDNYATRKLIDAEDSTINLMESTTPIFRVGIEKGDDLKKLIGITKSEEETPAFKILNVDFGITERARQLLDVEKTVDTIEITVGASTVAHGKIIEEDGVLKLSEDSSKYLTYIPPSLGQGSGMIKAEIDSELLHGAKAKIKYNISVLNNSEIDYDTKEYYLYGYPGQESEIIKYIPIHIYDYLDNSLSYSEGEWSIQTLNADDGYNETVGIKTVTEEYLRRNHMNLSADSKDYIGYEDFQSKYEDAINNWTQNNVNRAREKRLNGKTVLKYIGNIDIVNENKDISIIVEGELVNTQEIDLNNDVEITNVERVGDTGRIITPSSLYDTAESIVITPPTGENQNHILITGIAISLLVTIGAGIIVIKKKVLR